ncbi:hypothetical protein [Nocardia goodfellowii]|uniref:ESX-1 secretion-associated protein n=1 Tax=Nocardia goodfellowii TaxID=882446 RepID=A0ABS4QBR9_9NOCA|nr:hypothetical protein [Nocardia goodfellowii]MBP2189127.1 hypothetical protein [Nocardia goodfellowii]
MAVFGFEVTPGALRAASEAARQAAGVVRELEVGRVAELAAALPGTESATTAAKLARHWKAAGKKWAKGMDVYAATAASAADTYRTQDRAGARGIEAGGL